jgi:hypothetical protein
MRSAKVQKALEFLTLGPLDPDTIVERHVINWFLTNRYGFKEKAEELIEKNQDHQWVVEKDYERTKLTLIGIDYEFGETERLTVQYEQNPH